MPRNLEIKARIDNVKLAQTIAQSINATYAGVLHQVDTYFIVQQGRLKLREIIDSHSELIYYLREETSVQRKSDYEIHPVHNGLSLKRILEHSLGIAATVQKTRTLFLYGDARIHIDEVKELGSFLEFEVPVLDSHSAAEQTMQFLIEKFNIQKTDFLHHSYLDMMLDQPTS